MMKKRVMDKKGQRRIFMVSSVLLTLLAFVQVVMIFVLPAGGQNTQKKGYAAETDAAFLYPERIYVTLGGKDNDVYFCVEDEQEAFVPLVQNTFALTERLLKEGDFQQKSSKEIEWNRLSLVAAFPCTLDQVILEQTFGVNDLPAFSFSQMIIFPSNQAGTGIKAVFLCEDGETAWTVETKRETRRIRREWEENLTLCEELITLSFDPAIQGGPRYMEVGHRMEMFPVGTFAEKPETRISVRSKSTSEPFSEKGKLRENVINEYAVRFFDSPEAVTRLIGEQSVVYSDEKITVKVSKDGWIEYRETLTDAEKVPVDLMETYQIALDFLEAEIGSSEAGMNTVLADCFADGDSMVFMFDYEMDGRLLEIGGEENSGSIHPVTVNVTGGKVRTYRRLILVPEMEEDTVEIRENWLEIMDLYAEKGIVAAAPPVIVYYYDGKTIAPAWKFSVLGEETEDALIIPIS